MSNSPRQPGKHQEDIPFEPGKKKPSDPRAAHPGSTDQAQPQPPRRDLLLIKKTVRVPPSGDVFLTELEAAIVDSADFQRLRRIRQLGTVCFVYPGALHTRFDHSLGVLKMAETMIQAIRSNSHNVGRDREISDLQECLIRAYALLHDITHVPFGHTIEDELRLFTRHDDNPARIARFLGPQSDVGQKLTQAIGEDGYNRFMSVYQWHGGKYEEDATRPRRLVDPDDAFVYDLVSNTVCADLLDYIRRDSYFCGLDADLEYRFLNYLYLREHDSRRRVFVRLWKDSKPTPRRDTLTDLVRLLHARYLIAERAYFHHAKIVTGSMLGRALQDATDVDGLSESDLYRLGDDTLLARLEASKSPTASRLASALTARQLHKILVEYHESDFDNLQAHEPSLDAFGRVAVYHETPVLRRSIEDLAAEQAGAQQGDVLLYVPDREMNLKAAEMLVWWNGKAEQLKDINDRSVAPRLQQIIRDHQNLWGVYVIVARHLSEQQQKLVRDFFNILLTVPEARSATAKECYCEDLIRQSLARDGFTIHEASADAFAQALKNAAANLGAVAHDPRNYAKRLQETIAKQLHGLVSRPGGGES